MGGVDAEDLCGGLNTLHEPAQRKRVEYWSKTYRTWIPAEIIAVDEKTCAVQVNVKPGVWLSSSDWDRKLRVAVYLCSDSSEPNHLDYPQTENDSDSISNPQLHEAAGSGLENVYDPNINQMYPSYPPKISRSPRRSPGKVYESNTQPLHDASNDASYRDKDGQAWSDIIRNSAAPEMEGQARGCTVTADDPPMPDVFVEEPPMPEAEEGTAGESAFGTWMPESYLLGAYVMAAPCADTNDSIMNEGTFAGYCCPNCGQGGLASVQHALLHCEATGKPLETTGVASTEEPTSHLGIDGTNISNRQFLPSTALGAATTEEPLSCDGHHSVQPASLSSGDGTTCRTPTCSVHAEDHAATMPSREQSSASSADPVDVLKSSSYHAPGGCPFLHRGIEGEEDGEAEMVSIFSRPRANSRASGTEESAAAQAAYEQPWDELLQSNVDPKSYEPSEATKKPKTRVLGYCCPRCGQGELATLHEAVQHCRKPEEPVHFQPPEQSNDDASEALPSTRFHSTSWATPPVPALPGEPVAYNSYGQPIIARQADPDTGGRTVVLNENGTCDVFGKQTIASLLSSTETEADDWIQVLSDYQLRGLVHEMGQRLLESSQIYQARLSQWENLSEKANLAFFGLSEKATDRELDVAYRQLSKKMHPDKNGGTEESKQRFQEMKTRYEALKKKRGSQDADEQAKEEENEKQDDEETEKDDRTIEFDPTSRDSLFTTAKKMLSQLSTLDTSMATLVQQLQRHGL